jgi:hypothetical protein
MNIYILLLLLIVFISITCNCDIACKCDIEGFVSKSSHIHHIHKHRTNAEAMLLKKNFKLCKDSDKHHSCNIKYRKPPPIDKRYINIPSDKLVSSNIYNHLSICPQTYEKNMKILRNKKSIGQYSGYTENGYIDRTRYFKSKEPLPINPDFFMKGGGTYA